MRNVKSMIETIQKNKYNNEPEDLYFANNHDIKIIQSEIKQWYSEYKSNHKKEILHIHYNLLIFYKIFFIIFINVKIFDVKII